MRIRSKCGALVFWVARFGGFVSFLLVFFLFLLAVWLVKFRCSDLGFLMCSYGFMFDIDVGPRLSWRWLILSHGFGGYGGGSFY